ncbi:MAG: radical SAM protein, partial [Lacrimispora sp.]
LKKLWQVFSGECERYGILYRMKDIIHGYRKDYEVTQLSLFD